MADEADLNGGTSATAVAPTGTDAGATAPPSSSESNAADTAGKTAPPANLAREAFDRLAKGEQPRDVNRELYKPTPSTPPAQRSAAAKPSTTTTTTTKTTTPAAKDGQQTQASAQPQPGQWPEGISAKDQQVLKRAQMDADTWAAIPPSNQKKILANLATSQAAADRAFAQQRQQQAPGQAGKQAPAAGTQADPDPQDAATQVVEEPTQQQPNAQQQQQQRTATTPTANDAASADLLGKYLDPTDLETLKAIGGDDLANVYSRGISRVVTQLNQENSQLLGVAEFLLNEHVNGQFDKAVHQLAETPGLQTLNDGSEQSQKQLDALREKAMFLHRAAGDPRSYTFGQAVQDAAASLFKTNITQAAQAQLLASRKTSLRGSPDKGVGRRGETVKLSGKERDAAIFQHLREGKSPNDARNAVDG